MTSLNFLVPRRDFRFPPVDDRWDLLDVDRVHDFLANIEAIMDASDSLALYMNWDEPLRASEVEAELRMCLGDRDPRVIENRNGGPRSSVPLTWTRVLSGVRREDFQQVNDVYHLNVDGMVVEVPLMAYKMLRILQLWIGKQPAEEDVEQEKKAICILSQKIDGMIQGLTEAVDRMNRLQEKLQERQEAINSGQDKTDRSDALNRTQETSRIDQGTDGHQGGAGIEETRDDEEIAVEGSFDYAESSSFSDTASETSSVDQNMHDLPGNANQTSKSATMIKTEDSDSEDDVSFEEDPANTHDGGPISEQTSHLIPKDNLSVSPEDRHGMDGALDSVSRSLGGHPGHGNPRSDRTGGNSMRQGLMLEAEPMDVDMANEPVGRAGPNQERGLSEIPVASQTNHISLTDDEKRHGFYFIESLKRKRVKWADIPSHYAFRFNVHRSKKALEQHWFRWRQEGKHLLILKYTPGTKFPRPSASATSN